MPDVSSRFSVEEIGSIPARCGSDAVTSGGQLISFCPTDDGRITFSVDGVTGEPFDRLLEMRDETPAIFVSPDGSDVAYVAARGDRIFVGRCGGEGPPLAGFSRSVPPTFDGSGRHLAYAATLAAEQEYGLIVDGELVGGAVAPIRPAWSPDGSRLAYAEAKGTTKEDGRHRIVLDGTPGEWFQGLRNAGRALQFSPDGRRFAFYSVDGKAMARWTVDGRPQRWFNDSRSFDLAALRGVGVLEQVLPAAFSPDSRRFAYFADVVEKGVAVIEDDVAGPIVHSVTTPQFSPDSRHLAYTAQQLDKSLALILDGSVVAHWTEKPTGSPPVFSADSTTVAAMVMLERGGLFSKKQLVAVGGNRASFPAVEAEDAQAAPTLTRDGAHAAWWLRRKDVSILVVDGIMQADAPPPLSELTYDAADRLIYAGNAGDDYSVIIDGRPGPLVDDVAALFPAVEVWDHGDLGEPSVPYRASADGAHVAWVGMIDDDAHPVLDDEVGPAFKLVFDCQFQPDGSVRWWGQRDNRLYRIDAQA